MDKRKKWGGAGQMRVEEIQYIADHMSDTSCAIASALGRASNAIQYWKYWLSLGNTVDDYEPACRAREANKRKGIRLEDLEKLAELIKEYEEKGKPVIMYKLSVKMGWAKQTTQRWVERLEKTKGDARAAFEKFPNIRNYKDGRTNTRQKSDKLFCGYLCHGRCVDCRYSEVITNASRRSEGLLNVCCMYGCHTGTSRMSMGLAGLYGDDCPLFEKKTKQNRKAWSI